MRDGMPGTERLDLGLALLSIACIYGNPLTLEDIACWCGCTRQNIEHIQNRAMRRLRQKLSPETMKELREALEPARSEMRHRTLA